MESFPKWEEDFFDERMIKEIQLARLYASQFHHGTTGHNALMLISSLADIIDHIESSGYSIKTIYEQAPIKDIPNET